ncbi:hybrid sensor histidine kinase/response regulator [Azorhizobium doebereinerae]|uniref:hybrid sensor histidine kinase/response regulator n=1 Tax=Azorhizobium doebereinerae TaxID=281091 RepID=UPI0003F7E621|nr:response regulator [Azorhizobium doebereinerae]
MPADDQHAFLAGGGETGALIARFDWGATSLGPISGWPQSLRTAVSLLLRSNLPIVMLWNPDGLMIYNDAYSHFAGGRHPALLGSKVLEGWPEVAAFNAHVMDVGLKGGTLSYRDQHLVLHRHGAPEDVWMNLDYSPVLDESGTPAGVLAIVVETTERVRTEQRLRIAQEAGGVGIFEWFPETGRLDVSAEYRRIWRLPPDQEITDDLLVGLLHPQDRPLAGPNRRGRENPLEYTEYRRIDPSTGETRWIARRGEVVSSPELGNRRFVGIAMDITDRKRVEEDLRESEARWRNLFEQMQEGFFIGEAVRDMEGRVQDLLVIEVNPAFETQTGISAAQALGRTVRELIPNPPEAMMQRYADALAAPDATQFEIHVPQLANRWFEARARAVGTDRIAVLFLDISRRKAAEEAIRQSELRFRLLAQSMPNHVWTATADGTLDWFNDRTYAYCGRPYGTLDRAAWNAIVHPDDLASATIAWVKSREDGAPYQAELRLRRYDGAYRWHISRAVPVLDASGAVNRWVGSNTDIEDQKVAEAALADLAASLEARIEARTTELARTQDALRQSQKMESLGNLTGGVAHDFNNLLQVISGNLQLLARDMAGHPKAEQRIQSAMTGVARGSRLASQLLAFGRRQPLVPKVVNLGRFIANMDDLLRRALGEAVEIQTVIADGLWNTLIDPGNVENALLNLAINARDAMDGRGRLTIELSNAFLDTAYAGQNTDVTAGQYVLLAVTDTGCGMAPDLLEKVFEPFFTTKPEGKGTGLGLSMVYGFVKQSGGHIKLYSEPGQGTTVKLYLPRSAQAEDVLVDAETGPVSGGIETILVAEDDHAVREIVVGLLADLGYRVLKAKDAESALSIIESGMPIDLLFTDVVMPGPLKSTELARKARERLPNLAILFTSGYAENAIVHAGRLDEGVELLSKPYTREALARKLRQVLGGAGAAAPAAAAAAPPSPLPQAMPETARPATWPGTILLVEDDWLVRTSTVDMLEELGHEVLEAADGASALALLGKRKVDLLLTDIGLPDISGVALAQQARARDAALPIVFLTGQSDAGAHGLGAGVRVITKPYTAAGLADIIADMRDTERNGG